MGQINHVQNENLKIAFLYGGLLYDNDKDLKRHIFAAHDSNVPFGTGNHAIKAGNPWLRQI